MSCEADQRARLETKLLPVMGDALRKRRHGRRHVDETYLKIHGHWCYLYRAIDRHGSLLG